MTTLLSKNLRFLIDRKNTNVSRLAKEVGLNQSVLQKMVSGQTTNPNILSLTPIAKFFKITIGQLVGETPLEEVSMAPSSSFNFIPIIPWERLENFSTKTQHTVPSSSGHFKTTVNVSHNSFALKLDKLHATLQFPVGCMIIIDPDRKYRHGDFVLLNEQNSFTIKQVLFDGLDLYLKPTNPQFQVKKCLDLGSIMGSVVFMQLDFLEES